MITIYRNQVLGIEMAKYHKSELLIELLEDIDRGKFVPLTSVKNIEAVLSEFVDEYEDYAKLTDDLIEWHYIKAQ